MKCMNCPSDRLLDVTAKCGDLARLQFPNGNDQRGYVPSDLGIGYGDYIEFTYCLQCGQIQGEFPKEIYHLED